MLRRLAEITYPSYVATISYNHPYSATVRIERRLSAACFSMHIAIELNILYGADIGAQHL